MKKKNESFRSLIEQEYKAYGHSYLYEIKYYGAFAVVVQKSISPSNYDVFFDFHHPDWIETNGYISVGNSHNSEELFLFFFYERLRPRGGTWTLQQKQFLQACYEQLLTSPIDWTEYLFSDKDIVRSFAARILNERNISK